MALRLSGALLDGQYGIAIASRTEAKRNETSGAPNGWRTKQDSLIDLCAVQLQPSTLLLLLSNLVICMLAQADAKPVHDDNNNKSSQMQAYWPRDDATTSLVGKQMSR